jgi:succinate dehydrogenase hydrophobic anchor subunit
MRSILQWACLGFCAALLAVFVFGFVITTAISANSTEIDFAALNGIIFKTLALGAILAGACGAWIGWNRRRKS